MTWTRCIGRPSGGEQFYNTSPLTMTRLLDDPTNIADNLHAYLRAFSPGAADVLEKFDLPTQVDRLARADLLYLGSMRRVSTRTVSVPLTARVAAEPHWPRLTLRGMSAR